MSEKSNISTHLKLFETCVKPFLVYCSEIWSLNIVKSNVDLESKYLSMLPVKVQIKFAKASSFPEHIKIFSQFFINCVKKSLVRKNTLIIPNMGEMKLIQKYFDPCRKAVG
jgi:hypothetical protein